MSDWEILTHDAGARFDSGAGLFEVIGREAAACLNRMVTADLSTLQQGEGRSSLLLNDEGAIIARLMLHRFSDRFLIRTAAGSRALVWSQLLSHKRGQVRLRDISQETVRLQVIGPGSAARLEGWISPLPASTGGIVPARAGHLELLLASSEAGRPPGFDLYTRTRDAGALLEVVQTTGIVYLPESESWEVLRIEWGEVEVGREIAPDDTPVEAGLLDLVVEGKGAPFPGEMAVNARRRSGARRRLVSLRVKGSQLPQLGMSLQYQGREVGEIRAATHSPGFGVIAIGAITPPIGTPGTGVMICSQDRQFEAVVDHWPLAAAGQKS